MKPSVNPDWWKKIFDEIYLLTDARTVCDEELTRKEVDFIILFMGMKKITSILDMCGGHGRHSIELARRGFRDLTVLDYSDFLLGIGRKKARDENLDIRFIQGDARFTGMPANRYHNVINMASSFGYFTNDRENRKILMESFRLLQAGGRLLLDLPDRDYVLKNFKPTSVHRVNDDIYVKRQRMIKKSVIYSKETVISEQQGCIRENTYCTKLYSGENIKKLLMNVGFDTVSFKKDFMNRKHQGDFGCMTNRMLVIADKS